MLAQDGILIIIYPVTSSLVSAFILWHHVAVVTIKLLTDDARAHCGNRIILA